MPHRSCPWSCVVVVATAVAVGSHGDEVVMVEEVVVEVVEVVCGSGRRESVRKFQHDKY